MKPYSTATQPPISTVLQWIQASSSVCPALGRLNPPAEKKKHLEPLQFLMMFSNQSKITRHDKTKNQVIKNKGEKKGGQQKDLGLCIIRKGLDTQTERKEDR